MMERTTGIEPATGCLEGSYSAKLSYVRMAAREGVEPSNLPGNSRLLRQLSYLAMLIQQHRQRGSNPCRRLERAVS